VPKLKLIVEYDSAMHGKYNSFFHKTVKGYVGAVMRDQAKDRMAKKAGWTLMRVVEGAPEGGLYVRRFIEQKRSR
jgi:very-short-patch-repair endonuclease